MGRSNATYRNQISQIEKQYKRLRRALLKKDKKYFDELFVKARNHADAGSIQNPLDPTTTILLSILIEQQKEIHQLKQKTKNQE